MLCSSSTFLNLFSLPQTLFYLPVSFLCLIYNRDEYKHMNERSVKAARGGVTARKAQGGGWVFTEITSGVISSPMQSCVVSKNKDGLDSKLSPNQQASSLKYWNTIISLFHKYIKTHQAQFLQYITLISIVLICKKGPSINWQLGSVQVARKIQEKNFDS